MREILVINSSATLDGSVSRALVEDAVDRLLEASPGAKVTRRDLSDGHIRHLTPATVSGIRATAQTADEVAAKDLSDELIAELRAADVLVLGAPMYNFSIPSTLRAWFDHVLRPRVTFAYSEAGPKGLIDGLRAIVIQARGGFYSEGPTKALDFQQPYLKQLLGFIGINDVDFIHAERIGFGPEARDEALASAKIQIGKAVARMTSGDSEHSPAATPSVTESSVDYGAIMQANLERVFGERDEAQRIEAIRTLYATDAVLHEPDRSVQGHEAISQAVTELLGHLPPDFAFRAVRPALGHNGVGRLQWRAGPPGGPAAVTGTDVAHVENGVIQTLHVFLDQSEA